jgi:hypothetical protein
MAGGEYGEGQEMMDIQSAAPMSRAPEMRPSRAGGRAAGGGGMVDESMGLTPLTAPSQRPDEPITAGAPFGAGPGPSAPPQTIGRLTKTLEKIVAYDRSDRMQYFYMLAQSRGW